MGLIGLRPFHPIGDASRARNRDAKFLGGARHSVLLVVRVCELSTCLYSSGTRLQEGNKNLG